MRPPAVTLSPAAILAILIAVTFGLPVLLGLTWLPQPSLPYPTGTSISQSYMTGYDDFSFAYVDWPWRRVARSALSSGEWPLWNPYSSLGLPFPEQYQNQIFFPIEWLEIFLGPLGWSVLFVGKVYLAGLGAMLFIRRIVPCENLQIVGAVLYSFSAYFLWFHSIAAFVNGATLVPWLFWGGLRVFDTRVQALNRIGALAAAMGLLLLSGQPQISALAVLSMIVFVFVCAICNGPILRSLQPLLLAFCALVLGALIASAQLDLFWQISTYGYSLHSAGAYGGGGTTPLNFVVTVWPFVFGQLMAPWDAALYPGRLNAEGWPIVLGTSGLILLALGIGAAAERLVKREKIPPAVLGMLLVLLVSLLIVVSGTLGYALWNIRGLNRINFPRYIAPILALAISVLVCWGISVFTTTHRTSRVLLGVAVSLIFAVLLISVCAVIANSSQIATASPRYLELSFLETFPLSLVVGGTLLAGLTLVLRNGSFESRLPIFVGLCVFAESSYFIRYGLPLPYDLMRLASVVLFCAAALLMLSGRRKMVWAFVGVGFLVPIPVLIFSPAHLPKASDVYEFPSPATDFLNKALGSGSSGGRILSTHNVFHPNIGSSWGIAELPSLNPQQIDTTASYIFKLLAARPLNYTTPNAWSGVQDGGDYPTWSDYSERRQFYNQVSVRFLIDRPNGWLSTHPLADVVLVYTDAMLNIYEDMRAFPRAYSVSSTWPVASSDKARSAMLASQIDPTKTAIVEVPMGLATPKYLSEDALPMQPVRIDELKFNRVSITADVRNASLVVLTDAYYPGWVVSVDGETSPLLRVAGALRGVLVPSGTHKIVFTYKPRGIFWWAVVSIASALLVGWMIFISIIKARRKVLSEET